LTSVYGENHQGGVVLELRATKIRDLREQLPVQFSSGADCVLLSECCDPLHSKLFALRVLGLGDAVCKERQPVSGFQIDAGILIIPRGKNAEQRAAVI
jgi:hypothetical protein